MSIAEGKWFVIQPESSQESLKNSALELCAEKQKKETFIYRLPFISPHFRAAYSSSLTNIAHHGSREARGQEARAGQGVPEKRYFGKLAEAWAQMVTTTQSRAGEMIGGGAPSGA